MAGWRQCMASGETAVLVVTAQTLNCCLSSLRWFCTVSRTACSSPRRLSSACLSCSSFPLSRASARRRRSSAFATLLRHRVCAGAQSRSETRPQTAQALEQAIEGSGGRGACDGVISCRKRNISNPFLWLDYLLGPSHNLLGLGIRPSEQSNHLQLLHAALPCYYGPGRAGAGTSQQGKS